MIEPNSPLKRCSKCSVEKTTDHFNKASRNKDGLSYSCRECVHQDYLNNKEKIIERVKKYDAAHREERKENVRKYGIAHREERKKYAKEYRIKNYDERVKKDHEYYLAHKDNVAETVRKYNQTPMGKAVAAKRNHKRRANGLNVENTLTLLEWETILKNQKYKCAKCGKPFNKTRKPTKDHIVPLSQRVGLTFENTQALCRSCNCSKNDKLDNGKITTWCLNETNTQQYIHNSFEKRSTSHIKYFENSENRKKYGLAQKKRYERPEEHEKLSNARKKVMASPEARQRLSDAKKKQFLDKCWYGSVKYVGDRKKVIKPILLSTSTVNIEQSIGLEV
jgi:transposase-like protein